MNLKTLTGAREVLEAAGCPVADLNGAGLESNCPVCLAPMTVTKGDEWVEFGCAAGCGREDVVYELAIRSGQVARPPDTGPLLDELVDFMGRFVVLPSMAARRALALFVLHTWAFDSAYATPYIVVESPEKQSRQDEAAGGPGPGVPVAAEGSRASAAAALFQVIEASKPTLLIDEADAIFGGNHEHHEALRGVLNAGNMPGSPVAARRAGRRAREVRRLLPEGDRGHRHRQAPRHDPRPGDRRRHRPQEEVRAGGATAHPAHLRRGRHAQGVAEPMGQGGAGRIVGVRARRAAGEDQRPAGGGVGAAAGDRGAGRWRLAREDAQGGRSPGRR